MKLSKMLGATVLTAACLLPQPKEVRADSAYSQSIREEFSRALDPAAIRRAPPNPGIKRGPPGRPPPRLFPIPIPTIREILKQWGIEGVLPPPDPNRGW